MLNDFLPKFAFAFMAVRFGGSVASSLNLELVQNGLLLSPGMTCMLFLLFD